MYLLAIPVRFPPSSTLDCQTDMITPCPKVKRNPNHHPLISAIQVGYNHINFCRQKKTRGTPSGSKPNQNKPNQFASGSGKLRPCVACTQASEYANHGYNPMAAITCPSYAFCPLCELSSFHAKQEKRWCLCLYRIRKLAVFIIIGHKG